MSYIEPDIGIVIEAYGTHSQQERLDAGAGVRLGAQRAVSAVTADSGPT